MLSLALAVACNLAVGMIFKVGANRGMDRLALLTVNYVVALGMALAFLLRDTSQAEAGLTLTPGLAVLGLALGLLFILSYFMLSMATEVAGMSLAMGVMRVSVVIPFLASWLVWSEHPSPAQMAGLVLAGTAFFLIARKGPVAVRTGAPPPEHGHEQAYGAVRTFAVLGLLFVSGGMGDVLMKTFDEAYAATNSTALFLLLVFGVAFVVGLAFVLDRGLRRRRWPRGATILLGILLGVVNYGSAAFILRAITQLSGPFVFPANSIAIVLGGALLGVSIWKERLSTFNWLGLAMAAVALLLLNL